jgi:hypothetical protein
MTISQLILTGGVIIFLFSAITMLVKVFIRKVKPDPSSPKGSEISGIAYSLTFAMSPLKKESAFLHLPTYTAGMIYHVGTFLAFLWLILLFFDIRPAFWISSLSIVILFCSFACGLGILIKRMVLPKLRNFSNPDDYISNILVSVFQFLTAFTILLPQFQPYLFVFSAILFLYIPVGKLRHCIFFFTSRIYLGKFYGKRGVWPIKHKKG